MKSTGEREFIKTDTKSNESVLRPIIKLLLKGGGGYDDRRGGGGRDDRRGGGYGGGRGGGRGGGGRGNTFTV